MIIDPTDFNDRPYKVPNQEESRDFISFIEEKEEELGIMILGQELWDEFTEALASSGPLDTIWEELRDGGLYDYQNKQYNYAGWVDMVRPGIFAEWLPQTTWKLTNVGYIENSTPDKATLVDNQYDFHVHHWNKFVSKVGYSYPYGYNCKNSFYGFMTAHADDYPTWDFRCPRYKNRYDL